MQIGGGIFCLGWVGSLSTLVVASKCGRSCSSEVGEVGMFQNVELVDLRAGSCRSIASKTWSKTTKVSHSLLS